MSTGTLAAIGAVTGVVGAMTGIVSLVWQIVTHRRSGRLVTVKSSYMIPVYGPHHVPEFHDDDQVAITVSNHGGTPVTVTNYGVAMGGKRSQSNLFVMELPIWATKLPVSVELGGKPAQVVVPVVDLGSNGQRDTGLTWGKGS